MERRDKKNGQSDLALAFTDASEREEEDYSTEKGPAISLPEKIPYAGSRGRYLDPSELFQSLFKNDYSPRANVFVPAYNSDFQKLLRGERVQETFLDLVRRDQFQRSTPVQPRPVGKMANTITLADRYAADFTRAMSEARSSAPRAQAKSSVARVTPTLASRIGGGFFSFIPHPFQFILPGQYIPSEAIPYIRDKGYNGDLWWYQSAVSYALGSLPARIPLAPPRHGQSPTYSPGQTWGTPYPPWWPWAVWCIPPPDSGSAVWGLTVHNEDMSAGNAVPQPQPRYPRNQPVEPLIQPRVREEGGLEPRRKRKRLHSPAMQIEVELRITPNGVKIFVKERPIRKRKPPRPPVRFEPPPTGGERKTWGKGMGRVYGRISAAVSSVTELIDIIQCIRRNSQYPGRNISDFIANHLNKPIDTKGLIECLVQNEIEDFVIGKINRSVVKEVGKTFEASQGAVGKNFSLKGFGSRFYNHIGV